MDSIRHSIAKKRYKEAGSLEVVADNQSPMYGQ